ncbi:MAG: esterase family protein [Cohnella sp.]|nr:esterase family protein [Cohnella sp.]
MRLYPSKLGFLFVALFAVVLTSCSGNEEKAPSPAPTTGADSSVVQRVSFRSEALDRKMNMNVYLPADYDPEQRYPVLYLIHGYGGDEKAWTDLGIDKTADRLIADGKIKPLLIVMPAMNNSYGINSSQGKYEDYLAEDVVSYVDAHYGTIADRSGRSIGGLSMGGFISLHTAFLHPDMFGKVGGHSPAIFVDDWSTTGGVNGLKAFLYPTEEARRERDPLLLAETLDLSTLEVYLDCGEQDYYKFYDGSEKLYKLLQSKGVPAQYHHKPGEHDGAYWMSMEEDYLKFYDGAS